MQTGFGRSRPASLPYARSVIDVVVHLVRANGHRTISNILDLRAATA